MIYFVGAGPGAEDLITVRGQALLTWADVVLYAGAQINPALLALCGADCEIVDSAMMTPQEMISALAQRDGEDAIIVRLQADDPAARGAIREQADALRALGIAFKIVPGV